MNINNYRALAVLACLFGFVGGSALADNTAPSAKSTPHIEATSLTVGDKQTDSNTVKQDGKQSVTKENDNNFGVKLISYCAFCVSILVFRNRYRKQIFLILAIGGLAAHYLLNFSVGGAFGLIAIPLLCLFVNPSAEGFAAVGKSAANMFKQG